MCGTYMLGLAAPPVPDGRPSRYATPKPGAFQRTRAFNQTFFPVQGYFVNQVSQSLSILKLGKKITLDFNRQMSHTGSSLNIAVMVSAIICLTTCQDKMAQQVCMLPLPLAKLWKGWGLL